MAWSEAFRGWRSSRGRTRGFSPDTRSALALSHRSDRLLSALDVSLHVAGYAIPSNKFTEKERSKGAFKVAEIILQIRQLLSASFTANVCAHHSPPSDLWVPRSWEARHSDPGAGCELGDCVPAHRTQNHQQTNYSMGTVFVL